MCDNSWSSALQICDTIVYAVLEQFLFLLKRAHDMVRFLLRAFHKCYIVPVRDYRTVQTSMQRNLFRQFDAWPHSTRVR